MQVYVYTYSCNATLSIKVQIYHKQPSLRWRYNCILVRSNNTTMKLWLYSVVRKYILGCHRMSHVCLHMTETTKLGFGYVFILGKYYKMKLSSLSLLLLLLLPFLLFFSFEIIFNNIFWCYCCCITQSIFLFLFFQ